MAYEVSKSIVTILEQIPMPIVIHQGGQIVDCNTAALDLASIKDKESVYGQNILAFLTEESQKKAMIFMMKQETYTNELFQFVDVNGVVKDIEIKKSYFADEDEVFSFLIMNDVTDYRKGLKSAAKIQQAVMDSHRETSDELSIVTGYYPKELVSGDFYYMNQYDEYHLLGILGDVKGKGIGAALSTSALKILFYDSGLGNESTRAMASNINRSVQDYLGEEYVAAIMYRVDLIESMVSVTSAGISEFIIYSKDQGCQMMTLKGPYLGMLEEDMFENNQYSFERGAEIYLFSDGFEKHSSAEICSKMNLLNSFEERVRIFKKYTESETHDDMTYVAIRRKEIGEI